MQFAVALTVVGLGLQGNPVLVAAEGSSRGLQAGGASYEAVFAELASLEPLAGRAALVSGLTLERDVGRFTLESGAMFLLSPVNGRTVGALFMGRGRFAMTPPTAIERDQLHRVHGAGSLDERFTTLFLLFSNTTLAELEAKLAFAEGEVPRGAERQVRDALKYLCDEDSQSADPAIMVALLSEQSTGMFYAHFAERRNEPMMFRVDPERDEEVSLLRRARHGSGNVAEVITQFSWQQDYLEGRGDSEGDRGLAEIRRYTIETTLSANVWGELSFAARAALEVSAVGAEREWVWLLLYPGLEVDSAFWADGRAAAFFKGQESPVLWIRSDPPLSPERTRRLTLHYHGDLIDRVGDWFFIESSGAWYPRTGTRAPALFDLQFRSPTRYPLVSVGELVELREEGDVTVSRWVTSEPVRNATFNLGIFETHEVEIDGAPPVTLLVSEAGHRDLSRWLMRHRGMKEEVGADIANSLKFFQSVFGDAPRKRFYASEIPYARGESFPGMIQLSWTTFQMTRRQGEDEVFRAHEVAHQWWGIGVDFRSYHDQWLSEGFSQFAGLWYLQTVHRDNEKYFSMLRRWREEIVDDRRGRDPAGPIWLGHRATTGAGLVGYGLVVYNKAAWVLHMLRVLMLDLQTVNEDGFKAMLRDFYATYAGRQASTEQFRRVVERHTRRDMTWFFDQWVYGTAVPTYRVSHRVESVPDGSYRVRLRVRQENTPDDFEMYVPVSVQLDGNQWARLRVHVKGPVTELDLPLMPSEPRRLVFNDIEGVLCEVKSERWRD